MSRPERLPAVTPVSWLSQEPAAPEPLSLHKCLSLPSLAVKMYPRLCGLFEKHFVWLTVFKSIMAMFEASCFHSVKSERAGPWRG